VHILKKEAAGIAEFLKLNKMVRGSRGPRQSVNIATSSKIKKKRKKEKRKLNEEVRGEAGSGKLKTR